VYVADADLCIVYWNKCAQEITGYSQEQVVGETSADTLLSHLDKDGAMLPRSEYPLAMTLQDGVVRTLDLFLRHLDGHRVPVSVRVVPVRNPRDEIIGVAEIFRDNSAQVAALAEIEELHKVAWLDALTQVGNRRYTENRIQSRLEGQERYGNPFGLLFLDIDHFKTFNDNYGHATGDQVLQMVSRTLAHNLKSLDFVGRWGGEEFIVLIASTDAIQLLADAERIRRLIMHSFLTTAHGALQVTASVGATMSQKGDTLEKLVQRADKLMYHSKSAGRNRVTVKIQRRARKIPL
jgi:diguanylate cyclase (GGDEF)-like protein/PAS domain S-box-containing protein